MLENLEKHAVYKILSLIGLVIGIVFGAVKLKQELMPSEAKTASAAPAQVAPSNNTPTDTASTPPFATPQAAASAPAGQYVQNQIYIDLDNFQLGKQYAGKSVEMPIIFDGFTPWLMGPASPATAVLAKRYLFLSHFDINQPKPPQGMLSSQTVVVPLDKAQALREIKLPARLLLTGQVKLFDVKKELGMTKKSDPDTLIFEVKSFKAL